MVLPGAGQIAQGRWFAGSILGFTFVAASIVFLWCFFRIIVAFYRLGLDFSDFRPDDMPLAEGGLAFGLAIVTYAVALLDTYRSYRRSRREWAGRRYGIPPEPP